MKKYIFITLTTSGIGGGQLYVRDKKKYLKQQGYEVYIFSSYEKKKNLLDEKIYHINGLRVYPRTWSQKMTNKILGDMKKKIDVHEGDEIIIESLSIQFSMWGELFARDINAKHIIFSLSESNKITENELKYLEFKCIRGELASINPDFFYGVYDKSQILNKNTIKTLVAYMGDQVEDYASIKLDSIQISEINICVFGRLDKGYVEKSIDEVVLFARKHSNKKITLVCVGDTFQNRIKKNISKKCKYEKNILLFFTGALNPVPKKMFTMFDVIIAGAGCATLSHKYGTKTIAMDVREGKRPLGILGVDIKTAFDQLSSKIELHELLEKAILYGYGDSRQKFHEKEISMVLKYDQHFMFIKESNREVQYYDCYNIKLTPTKWIIDIICLILGSRNSAYDFLGKIKTLKQKYIIYIKDIRGRMGEK